MIKNIKFLGVLALLSLAQFVGAQQATSVSLEYNTAGYKENQQNSSKTISTDYSLIPSIKSEMSVSEGGSLTYTVPLETLKGLNNFQPNTALVYNSQAGNGNAGWGWSFTGLSIISRGGKSQNVDGITIGPQFDDNDPYYLDGQRLLKKSDTEYVTKNFSKIKITKSSGTYSFIIQYTDGKIAWYNELSPGQHYIVKMADSFDNEIHYTYVITNNTPRLDKISYGGTDTGTDKFYLKVLYKDRKKIAKIYRNGQQYINSKVISEIVTGSTYSGDYRKYTFSYDFVDADSNERLRTINVFNETGESLRPLNFNYNSPNSTGTAEVTKRQLATTPASTYRLGDVTAGNLYNNSGNDIFYVSTTVTDFRSGPNGGFGGSTPPPPEPGSIRNPIFYLNSPYGQITPSTYVNAHTRIFTGKTLINDSKITTNDQLIIVNTISKTHESLQGQIEIRDFKTGKTKVISGGPSIPWISSGFQGQQTYTSPPRIAQKMFIPGDFNNDGLFDLIYISGNTQANQKIYLYEVGKETGDVITRKEFAVTSLLLTEDNYRLLEMDGDGVPEIMIISGNQYGIYKINVNDMTIKPYGDIAGQSSTNILNDLSYNSDGKLITPILLGDFNGDGLTDFMTPQFVFNTMNPFSKLRIAIENTPQFIWWMYTSDGKKFIPSQLDLTAQKLAYIKPSQDETIPKQSGWDLFLWGPDNSMKGFAVGNVVVTDINNDGKSDLVSITKFGKIQYNDQNPLISNFTYENIGDLYTEQVYTHSCYNATAQAVPAIYINAQQGYKCLVPGFPQYVGPTHFSITNTDVPGIYMTLLPGFNKVKFFVNTTDNNGNTSFTKLNQEIDLKDEKITPFSLFTVSDEVNFLNTYKTSISNFDITTGSEFKITFNNNNFLEKQIQEVNNGSTVMQKVEYRQMMKLDTKEEICYVHKDNDLKYPLYTHQTNGALYLVNKIHTLFSGKILSKEYRYENAIQSLDGRGLLGFQKTYVSDGYESVLQNGKFRNKKLANALFWTVNTKDPLLDNVLLKTTYGGISKFLTETNFINQKFIKGNQSLILSTEERTTDNLRNMNVIKRYTYDEADDLKLKKTWINYGDYAITHSNFTYQPEFTNGLHYFYGKISEQVNNSFRQGDLFTAKEVSTYYPTNGSIKEIQKFSQNSQSLNKSFVYDNIGNLKQETISSAGIASQTTTYDYDSTNRYRTSTTTPDGLIASTVVNTIGRLLEETAAIGGLKTYYTYDGWGNITSFTDYLGKKTTISKSSASAIPGGIYQISKKREGGVETISAYDEFDREIQTKTQSTNGKWIVKKSEYDIFGKLIKKSEPLFEGEQTKWNTIEYDAYNRAVKHVTYTGKTVITCYEGLKVTVDDGHKKISKTLDPFGNTIVQQDHGGTINYTYYPNGSLKETNYEGSKTTFEIDDWGNKKKIVDPSSGTYTYQYDILGRLLREDNPKGYTVLQYDDFGQTISEKTYGKTPAENTSIEKFYQYNPTSKLLEKIYGTSNGKNFAYTTEYDQYYRIKGKKEETPEFIYSSNLTFDTFGRVDETAISAVWNENAYTTTSKTKNVYDSNGILTQQNDVNANKMIWHTSSVNALNQATQMEYGNGYIINNYYSPQDGTLLRTNHAKGGLIALDMMYDFDVNKEVLRSRNSNDFGKSETFEYDKLNRLLKETTNGTVTNQYSYDKRGRMAANLDLGYYNYNGEFDYKLNNIALNANGQQVNANRGFAEVTYNAFNSPLTVKVPNKEDLSFEYNLMKSRYSMISAASGKRKYYSADGAIEFTRRSGKGGGTLQIVTYITGDPYSANYIKKDVVSFLNGSQESQNYYLHRDHLGSILAISKDDGSIVEKRFFDAWGNLKGLMMDGQIVDLQQFNGETLLIDRGYTGHEHLWRAGLIHMNARIYDPIMRRFLSPDTIIQDPFNTQSYNKFGYVTNNPLLYTDPSGNIGLGAVLIIAVVVSAVTHAVINTINGVPYWYGMGQAITTGLASGIISFGIGSVATSIFSQTLTVGKAAFQAGMHALSGGAMSEIGGGKFISGFMSGAISSVVSSGVQALGESGYKFSVEGNSISISSFGSRNVGLLKALMLASGGLSGGLSSSIAGGNFWDGLKQGLLTSGLNHLAHEGAEAVDWKTASMDIAADKPQTGETDCVPTVARAAAKYLGIDLDVSVQQKAANESGGVRADQTKEYFEKFGLKVDALYEAKAKNDYYFHSGIPSALTKQAVKFIVESLQSGHPVYLGFSTTEAAGNRQGHAVLVTEIKYSEDFSRMKHINFFDPYSGRSNGQLNSFQNTYNLSETVYNIFSLSKP
ncbi:RHS repeat-associated core domain-containing protein [Chryseobacterium sp. GVT01B]|uniref:RHS repeat-associated core domain-containing protein n=1 Tax=Chryseobacterium sp. GVT01B TaxID=2862675 RepID=UPI001CBA98D0|nr:RHS repeat-associated core domain-containing protein [Chryseobacterium sp. GVT01B]